MAPSIQQRKPRFPKKLKTISMDMETLDYSNFEEDEIPNDFICFNVPITQSLTELIHHNNDTEFLRELNSSSNTTVLEHSSNSSLNVSSESMTDSNNSSPVISDDSFIFPNLENNSRAFNILDSDVQDLTLEFNSNLNFLANEKNVQEKINKKKITQISKKINKEEKFWIKFLNDCYYSMKKECPTASEHFLNKDFANHFNNKVANHINKGAFYKHIIDSKTSPKPHKHVSKSSPIKRSMTSSSTNSGNFHGNQNVIKPYLETDFVPNVLESDLFELNTKQFLSGSNADLRYKKKYALPNNSSVDFFENTNSSGLESPAKTVSGFYNYSNNSTFSVTSTASSTFSISPENNGSPTFSSSSSVASSPKLSQKQNIIHRDSILSQTSARSSTMSVNSFGSLFRNSYTSETSSKQNSLTLSDINQPNYLPNWWTQGISTSPLPPLLLKFSLLNDGFLVNENINSMSLRSIVWYLSLTDQLNLNESTFKSLNKDVNVFLKNFEYYSKLVSNLDKLNPNNTNARNQFQEIVTELKDFLSKVDNKDTFKKQARLFKSLTHDINSLKIKNKYLKQDLKMILTTFYFYLFNIGYENFNYHEEMISFSLILLENLKSPYLAFNCLVNLVNSQKCMTLRNFILLGDDFHNEYFSENDNENDNNHHNNNNTTKNISSVKTLVKLLKNNFNELYTFLKNDLEINNYPKLNELINCCLNKIFNIRNTLNDKSHKLFIERILDILFVDKNNDYLIYLVVIFLKLYQVDFLNIRNDTAANRFSLRTFNLKRFIGNVNNNSNELLFKHFDINEFLNDFKLILIMDVSNKESLDDQIEYNQLGLNIV